VARRRLASPYKFLDAYGVKDRSQFFGRGFETDLLVADVVVSRLVVLFAKTGTGKTSLINAGVRPRLHDRGYKTYLVRVRDDPFVEARAALREQEPKHFPEQGTLAEQLRGLALRVRRPIVVFFDQFEEFFLYTTNRDAELAQEFVAMIGNLYDDAESGVHVVFSMREEWFVEMGLFRDRIPAIFHNDSNLRLRWFDRTQARDAIVKPAGDHAYEPELVDTLIEELAQTSRALSPTPPPGEIEPAQLQIVCDTLWRQAGNGLITIEDYRRLGDQRRRESVAQQILDRRLVQEFENLDKPQLELLGALLPELKTQAGTKRVREYEDLVSALQTAPTLTGDRQAIRTLLERLRRERLVDILPRGDGEIIELTHDYLAIRLDGLLARIELLWPRRVLAEGVAAFRKRGELLHSTVAWDVIQTADKLGMDPLEGELVLRSALAHLVDANAVLPAILHSGAPVWKIFGERILGGADAERARAVEMLIALATPEADAVLADAMSDETVAPYVVRLLGRARTERSVDLLGLALGRPGLAPEAEAALADLGSSPGQPEVAAHALDRLMQWFATRLADPAAALDTIAAVVRLDTPASVELLLHALDRQGVAEPARQGLLALSGSRDTSVAMRARTALVARIEETLAAGAPEPWCVETLEQLADPGGVELLGRMLDQPPLAQRARDALVALQRSEHDAVVTAATRQLAGSTIATPEPSPPPPPIRAPESSLEPRELDYHFDSMLRLLANGRLITFLGPGASIVDRPSGVGWIPGAPYPPLAHELANYLATRYEYPEREPPGLSGVAEYVQLVAGRAGLNQELKEIFSRHEPTSIHRLLARLPRYFRARTGSTQIVVTTAFDDCVERAFMDEREAVDVLSYVSDDYGRGAFVHRSPYGTSTLIENPQQYIELRPEERTVVLRLYGGIDIAHEADDSFVVTEDDLVQYAAFATRLASFLPLPLAKALSECSLLFLGQDLLDWTLRILLNGLRSGKATMPSSWAVQLSPSKVAIELWRHRGVEILDLPLDVYAPELLRRLHEFDVAAVPA